MNRLNRRALVPKLVILSAFCALFLPELLSAQDEACILLNVYEPQAFPKNKNSSISLQFSSKKDSNASANAAALSDLNDKLVETLKESLVDSKYFTSVTITTNNNAPVTDYLLEGGIAGIKEAGFAGRVWGGGAQMRANGRLLGPQSDATSPRSLIADWECVSANRGGLLGGNILPGTSNNSRAAQNNSKNIAKTLARFISDKDAAKKFSELATEKTKDSSKAALEGSTKPEKRNWRSKATWEANDYADEIESFVAVSDRKRGRGAEALWVTDPAYQANKTMLAQLNISAPLNRNEIKPGVLIDLDRVKEFAERDVYIFALFSSVDLKDAPFLWHSEDVRRSTYLIRADEPNTRISPIEFVDGIGQSYALNLVGNANYIWARAVHPTLIGFPTRKADGTPLVRGLSDVFHMHTVVDGRQVVLKIDLSHYDLKSVNDLKLR